MLWLVRDDDNDCDFGYVVFSHRPKKNICDLWASDRGELIDILPHDSPVKLKPGEGPVRVRLVKVRKKKK